jgi:hypothetical protein
VLFKEVKALPLLHRDVDVGGRAEMETMNKMWRYERKPCIYIIIYNIIT